MSSPRYTPLGHGPRVNMHHPHSSSLLTGFHMLKFIQHSSGISNLLPHYGLMMFMMPGAAGTNVPPYVYEVTPPHGLVPPPVPELVTVALNV